MAGRATTPSLAVGTLVRGYRLVRRLGVGSMGEVWEAEHTTIGKRAAIKVLKSDADAALNASQRLLEEARAVNAVRHPGIVDIFDVGVFGDTRPFLVMELLAGRPLSARLKAQGALPLAEAVAVLEGILEALAAAHRAGVVHRDLKPSNVFLVEAGPTRVKLLDFGVALRAGREEVLTGPSMAVGSVGYMAPEQLEGQASAASDLYGVGCLAFQLLTGRPVFPLKNIADAARLHLKEPPPRLRAHLPAASAALEAWVDHLLQKQPSARPASAEVALAALRRATRGRSPAGETTDVHLGASPPLPTRSHQATELVPAFVPPDGDRAAATTEPGPVPSSPGEARPTELERPAGTDPSGTLVDD